MNLQPADLTMMVGPSSSRTCSLPSPQQESTSSVPRGISPDEFPSSSHHLLASARHPSKTIPINSPIHRTDSELQLQDLERLAEHRDYCMFTRIVNGMSSRSSLDWNDSDSSLASIIKTRHTPVMMEGNFQQLEDRRVMYPYNMQCPPPEKIHMNNNGNLDGFGENGYNVTHKHYEQDYDDDDEGIFDMDL
mmetsp:Transcript_25844/g.46717  ORF Transcript_25844/g.46717 Transcript_25844/m.46717 type:complete len:191 (+) Transcript_25844:41-613(+)